MGVLGFQRFRDFDLVVLAKKKKKRHRRFASSHDSLCDMATRHRISPRRGVILWGVVGISIEDLWITWLDNGVRAFPFGIVSDLYFTSPKSIFSILQTHFYITPHIPFFILQNILLK